jgi:hypothetical protein
MTCHIIAYFQTEASAAAQSVGAQILHSYTGGTIVRLAALEKCGLGRDNQQPVILSEVLLDQYCAMMIAKRGGIFHVEPQCSQAMTNFINDKHSVLGELKTPPSLEYRQMLPHSDTR